MLRVILIFVLPNLLCSQGRIFLSHPYGTLGNNFFLTASISVSDLNRDGDLDVLVGNGRYWAEQNYIFYNTDHGFFRRVIRLGDELNTTYAILTADLDNDGDSYPDIITANSGSQNIIYLNQPAKNRDK